MRELSQWVFEVTRGEGVVFQIISVRFEGNFVGVGVDEERLGSLDKPDNTLRFTASKPFGQSHVLIFEFNFPSYAPSDGRYELKLTGSRGGSFTRFVSKTDANHDIDLILTIGEADKQALLQEQQQYDADGESSSEGGTGKYARPGVFTITLKRDRAEDLLNTLMIWLGRASGGKSESEDGSDEYGTLDVVAITPKRDTAEGLLNALIITLGGAAGAESEFDDAVTITLKVDTAADLLNALTRNLGGVASAGKSASSDERSSDVEGEKDAPQTGDGGEASPAHRRSKPRIVNVGFAAKETASKRIKRDMPLACDRLYYFWLEVGRLLKGNIDTAPVSLPTEHLPPDAVLKVVLYPFKGELQIGRGGDIGELKLAPDGSVTVQRQAVRPAGIDSSYRLLKRRLFFPVRAPKRIGVFRLRCNIYHKQILVQSRLIRARVVERPRPTIGALRSTVDYTLARTFSAAHLAGMEPHRLSVMLNANGDGTHGLRFWGEGGSTGREFKQDATISGQKLLDLIRQARSGLRKISWGDEEQWQSSKIYLYDSPRSFDELKADLIALAKRGYKFYDGIIGDFTRQSSGTADDRSKSADELADLMLKPGYVQIALKKSATLLIPASLIYDYPLDDGLKSHKICPAFAKDYQGKTPLEQTDCFNGLCPSRTKLDTVCPSGFWGYRHLVGLPLSVAGAENAPTTIDWQNAPQLTVAVSTNLGSYQQHQKALEKQFKAKWPALGWNYAKTRQATIEYMKDKAPQLVYFYCHGGLENNAPYIKVGPQTEDKLTRANLRAYHIRWQKPRPLVFINGCHTTAVEPEQALEFVSGFVEVANAAGVIGTEITVFEPLAKRFAEECLLRFIVDGQSIGEAVRGSRLALLKEGNPLGLIYIPFVMASLKMHQSASDN